MNYDEIRAELAALEAEVRSTEDITEARMGEIETRSAELRGMLDTLQDTEQRRQAFLAKVATGAAGGTTTRSFTPDGTPPAAAPAGPTPAASVVTRGAEADPDDPHSSIEYRRAFMAHVLQGAEIPAEFRAHEVSQTKDVGSAIPTTVLNQIVEKLEATGMILALVTRTAYAGGVSIPTSTVKPVASWVGESQGSDKQKKPTGKISFTWHKLRCAVAISLEVGTMALSAFESTLINNVVEAMVKAMEEAIISGAGTNSPEGIIAKPAPTGQALAVVKPTYEDLVKAEAALPMEYEAGGLWCMTKKTFMAFLGMTDETGQPIARVNRGIDGRPERALLGRGVVLCNYLPSFSDELEGGKIFAFIFNFKDYILNTNLQMGVKKYEDNETDDEVTKAVMLVDGKPVHRYSLVTLAKPGGAG